MRAARWFCARRGSWTAVLFVSLAAAPFAEAACGGSAQGVGSVGATAWRAPAIAFEFDSLDARPVSSASMHGKPAVITFVTTESLTAQAQVDFLIAMAKHDADRTAYAVVALDPDDQKELVGLYAKALSIPFAVAIADDATRQGQGPFGALTWLPVTVVLDASGREVFRAEGRVARSAEIRAAIGAAAR